MRRLRRTDRPRTWELVRLLPLAVLLACGSEPCILPPCLPPTALRFDVRSAASNMPVQATVAVSGVRTTTVPCQGACTVEGPRGTYQIEVSAPGYVTWRRTVEVSGSEPASCSCVSVETEFLIIALESAGS